MKTVKFQGQMLLAILLFVSISLPIVAQTALVSSEASKDTEEKGASITPNAAIGYMMAIGFLEPASEKVMNELKNLESVTDLDAVSSETINYLSGKQLPEIANLLEQGARCQYCRFGYDRTFTLQDPLPPFRALRELATVMRAYGYKLIKDGKADSLEKAYEIFKSLYRMGGHVQFDGTLICGMYGHELRKYAINGFEELLAMKPDDSIKNSLRQFLQAQPSSADGIKNSLKYEKKYTLQILSNLIKIFNAESNKEIAKHWDEVILMIPTEIFSANVSNKISSSLSPQAQECNANLSLLQGAIEMLLMDYKTLPATLSEALIPEFLVKEKYLKEIPVCKEGGKYQLIKQQDGTFKWICTIHKNSNVPNDSEISDSSPAFSDENVAKVRAFIKSPQFQKMHQSIEKLFDEALSLDPKSADFSERVQNLQIKIDHNLLARTVIPNIKNIYEKAIEKDKMVEKIVEEK